MTRITNFARKKRTYVEAGFGTNESPAETDPTSVHNPDAAPEESETKKRKRSRPNKKTFSDGPTGDGVQTQLGEGNEGGGSNETSSERPLKQGRFGDNSMNGRGQGRKFDKRPPKGMCSRYQCSDVRCAEGGCYRCECAQIRFRAAQDEAHR